MNFVGVGPQIKLYIKHTLTDFEVQVGPNTDLGQTNVVGVWANLYTNFVTYEFHLN